MYATRCDVCGKFRALKDVVYHEVVSTDWHECDDYIECYHCMSDSDREMYLSIVDSEEENENAKRV